MFDEQMRRGKERLLGPLARPLHFLAPWQLSLISLGMGVASAMALAGQAYGLGFILWFLNRLFDGLDGTLARSQGQKSDFGGYLDILIDFVVYALIPIGLVLGQPSEAAWLSLAMMLSVFYVNAASWMYLAAILEKRQHSQTGQMTSVTMPPGLIGGTETIILYTFFMLFSSFFIPLFYLMTFLVVITIAQRIQWAYHHLKS
jgi:phosphatidylglycerophosphate synthase